MEQDRKSKNKPCIPGQLIYNKGSKTIQWRKDSLFNKWCWENWTAPWGGKKSQCSSVSYRKINSKYAEDLNVTLDSKTLLEENIGILTGRNCSTIFFNPSPRLIEIKTKTSGT